MTAIVATGIATATVNVSVSVNVNAIANEDSIRCGWREAGGETAVLRLLRIAYLNQIGAQQVQN